MGTTLRDEIERDLARLGESIRGFTLTIPSDDPALVFVRLASMFNEGKLVPCDEHVSALAAKDAEIERLRTKARNWFNDIPEPTQECASFSTAEKSKLRPIAETLAMLDGNAFFTVETDGGIEHYEWYLPEAHALYESNGGDNGWAGEASFAKAAFTAEPHERADVPRQDSRSGVSAPTPRDAPETDPD